MKVAIIGGGAIGLSLGWELAERGHKITIIDQNQFGRKASWAGAGVLLPGNAETAIHPLEHLEEASNQFHKKWSKRLLEQTGIDNGYRKTGGLYVATSPGEIATLIGSLGYWAERKIDVEKLSTEEFASRFPKMKHLVNPANSSFLSAWMPAEAQICNPWHIKALVAACEKANVTLLPNQTVSKFEKSSAHAVCAIEVDGELIEVDHCVFACGAWTQQVASALVDSVQVVPVRGQIVLYRLDEPLELPVINEGTRYIVPRDDGHVLVGATIEEVGFDESTTQRELDQLAADAKRLVPNLTKDKIVQTWAGLRPGTHDGFPYMGRLPGFDNAFVSTGHFKTGLQLSSGSAVAMADLIEEKPSFVDLTPFDPSRVLL